MGQRLEEDRLDYTRGLRLPIHVPEYLIGTSDEMVIFFINTKKDEYDLIVGMDRYVEWMNMDSPFENDSVDVNRRRIGYYGSARQLQERCDAMFTMLRPAEKARIEAEVGNMDERWFHAQRLAHLISNIVQEPKVEDFKFPIFLHPGMSVNDIMNGQWPGKPRKLIVHGRAKSDFGIWAKMYYGHVNAKEIFDTAGIQIIAEDDNHAREIHEKILQYSIGNPSVFKLREPYTFERASERAAHGQHPTHDPIRNYLDKPSGEYRAIRANYADTTTGMVFEVQVTPVDVYTPTKAYRAHRVGGKALRQIGSSQ